MNRNVTSDVTKFIKAHAGQVVSVEEISAACGLNTEQSRYAMRRLIEKTTLGKRIKVISRGHAWEIGAVPGAKGMQRDVDQKSAVLLHHTVASDEDKLVLEEVGKLKDGSYVVRSSNGTLWKLTAI